MSPEEFSRRLSKMQQRVAAISGDEAVAPTAAVEDLRIALEVLQVADEELRQQNDKLAAAEVALEMERRRYQELFEFAPDAYLVTDLSGLVKEANRSACRLLRTRQPLLTRSALASFVAVQDRPRLRTLLNQVARGKSGHTVALQLQPRGAAPLRADLTCSLASDPNGNPDGIRWLIRDVTAREATAAQIGALNHELESHVAAGTADLAEAKRLSRDLIQREGDALRAAEASEAESRHVQKLESIGVLAGGIAHDFNNLLHVVLGNADIALSHLPAGSEAREPLDEVVRATLRAADLTRQLLAYSGKGAFVVEHLDLSSEVREMATLLRTAISKQATLGWELASDLPAVNADPTQIRQIVMNLITNASDALGDAGGTIALRTGVTRLAEMHGERFGVPPQVEEPVNPPDDPFVYLEIGDNGAGMTPDTLTRIFDPFFSTKFEGRGLGLAAVMGIVRTHHGMIRIRTERGEGTRFRVLFPAVTERAKPTEKPSTERSDWRGSGTILVVEDEEGVREVAERMLQEIGFQTIGAEDGRHALDIIERMGESITAVLLDLSMPRMGGAETLRYLRAQRPSLPVLMMSGYTEEVVAPQFSRSGPGPIGFIQKPFVAEELIAVLRRFAEVAT